MSSPTLTYLNYSQMPYLVLILCLLQYFSQGLTCAFCLSKLFTQLLIMNLQLDSLTLLLQKIQRRRKINLGKYFNITNGTNQPVVCHIAIEYINYHSNEKTTFRITGVYWSSNSSVRSCRDRHPVSLCLHLVR